MKKECVPEGQEKGKGKKLARGQEEGPMGSPQKETTEMSKLDTVIDLIEAELEGSEEGEPNEMKNAPSKDPSEELRRVEDDLTGNSVDLDEEPDEEDDYPDQYDEKGIASEMVDRTLLEQDSAYQTYFRGVMKKHGIKGIRGLSAEKRSAFFKDVSAGWRSRKKVKESAYSGYGLGMIPGAKGDPPHEIARQKRWEAYKKTPEYKMKKKSTTKQKRYSEQQISEDYKEYFKSMMKKHDIKNISDLEGDKKKEFFKKVNAGWKSKEEMKESIVYEEYKKYFTFMLEECGIEDFDALSETEQVEFYALVNEAFQIMNDQMQAPGSPIENPMSTYGNMIDKMKNQMRPERKARQRAAMAKTKLVRK